VCEAAQHYAQTRWNLAKNVSPQEADAVLERQICAGVYTEFEGVHLFKVTTSDAKTLRIDPHSILSTQPQGPWALDLRATCDIKWDEQTAQMSLMGKSGPLRLDPGVTTALLEFRAR
jgi:hypothetical protein